MDGMAHRFPESADQSRLISLTDALRPLQDQLGLSRLVCLLTIAAEPGLSVTELAARINAPQASTSRYVSLLLGRYQEEKGEAPAPLISQQVSKEKPRQRALFLTGHGSAFVAAIIVALYESQSSHHGAPE